MLFAGLGLLAPIRLGCFLLIDRVGQLDWLQLVRLRGRRNPPSVGLTNEEKVATLALAQPVLVLVVERRPAARAAMAEDEAAQSHIPELMCQHPLRVMGTNVRA